MIGCNALSDEDIVEHEQDQTADVIVAEVTSDVEEEQSYDPTVFYNEYLEGTISPDNIVATTGMIGETEKILLTTEELNYDDVEQKFIFIYRDIFTGIPLFQKTANSADMAPENWQSTIALPNNFVLLEDCVPLIDFLKYRFPNANIVFSDFEIAAHFDRLFGQYFFEDQKYEPSKNLQFINENVLVCGFLFNGEKKTLFVKRIQTNELDGEGNETEFIKYYDLLTGLFVFDSEMGDTGTINHYGPLSPQYNENSDELSMTEFSVAFVNVAYDKLTTIADLTEFYRNHIPEDEHYFIHEDDLQWIYYWYS